MSDNNNNKDNIISLSPSKELKELIQTYEIVVEGNAETGNTVFIKTGFLSVNHMVSVFEELEGYNSNILFTAPFSRVISVNTLSFDDDEASR